MLLLTQLNLSHSVSGMARRRTVPVDGAVIRAFREQQGLSLAALARSTGIARSALTHIEDETTREPHLRTAHAIADALAVPLTAVLRRHPSKGGGMKEYLYTPNEVADELDMSRATVYRMIRDGTFGPADLVDISRPGTKQSKTRIRASALERYQSQLAA